MSGTKVVQGVNLISGTVPENLGRMVALLYGYSCYLIIQHYLTGNAGGTSYHNNVPVFIKAAAQWKAFITIVAELSKQQDLITLVLQAKKKKSQFENKYLVVCRVIATLYGVMRKLHSLYTKCIKFWPIARF